MIQIDHSAVFTSPARFQVPGGLSDRTHVKVFGERNTGTNFLVESLALNAPQLEHLTHEHSSLLPALAYRVPGAVGQRLYNWALDRQRALEEPVNLGWKHGAIEPDRIGHLDLSERTLMICMTRNPYYFLNSLYRRPYNIIPQPKGDRRSFLSTAITPNRRDRVGSRDLPSPASLWSLKTRSYLESADRLNLCVVRYEDLVNDFPSFFEALRTSGVSLNRELQIPMKSSKGDAMQFSDYVAKTNAFDPREQFSTEELELIRPHLDADICNRLGYPIF